MIALNRLHDQLDSPVFWIWLIFLVAYNLNLPRPGKFQAIAYASFGEE